MPLLGVKILPMKIHFSPLVTQTTVHELKAGAVPVASLERSSGLPGCENRLEHIDAGTGERHTPRASTSHVERNREQRRIASSQEALSPRTNSSAPPRARAQAVYHPPQRRLERKSRRWLLSLARPRSRRSSPTRASPDAPTALASRPWPPACHPRTSRRPSDPSAASRCVSRVPTGAQGAGKT